MSRYWRARPGSKYGNVKVELDGHTFDSKKEAARYAELKWLEDIRAISDLKLQVPFELQPGFKDRKGKRHRAITYVADFTYYDCDKGEEIIEDVKSPATRKNPVYRLKKKMMAYKGYEITEV